MLKKRLIAILTVRDGLLVQSFGFSRYLPLGRPEVAAEFLSAWEVDEIALLDITAWRHGRGPDLALVERTASRCFVPLTIGGGITNTDQIHDLLRAGADKVAINSHALERPALIGESADIFGRQCVVVSIDARRDSGGGYQVMARGGTRATGLSPENWATQAAELGAGEVLLTSIDRDGSKEGYDMNLLGSVTEFARIPVIACGGVGKPEHFVQGLEVDGVMAVAAGNIFNFVEHSVVRAKASMLRAGVNVRRGHWDVLKAVSN